MNVEYILMYVYIFFYLMESTVVVVVVVVVVALISGRIVFCTFLRFHWLGGGGWGGGDVNVP